MECAADNLVDRIKAGDTQAEESLVAKYWRSLYYILNTQSQDPELAADMAQETFIVVINKARKGEIENPNAIAKFIRQVGVNLLIANYRKETRRKTDADDTIAFQFPDSSPDLLRKLEGEDLKQVVTQVIDELPTHRDRELLSRYFRYGQTKAQICEDFDLTPAHFDRVLHRARSRLKLLLQHKLGPEYDFLPGVTANVILATLFVHALSTGPELPTKSISSEMGENARSNHSYTIAVKDRPSFELEALQYQWQTR